MKYQPDSPWWRRYVGFERNKQAAANTIVSLVAVVGLGATSVLVLFGSRAGSISSNVTAGLAILCALIVVIYVVASLVVYAARRTAARKTDAFFRADNDPTYLAWMNALFDRMYGPSIRFMMFGRVYRALCLPPESGKRFTPPSFKEFFDVAELNFSVVRYEPEGRRAQKMVSEYADLVRPTARYANRLGFFVRRVDRVPSGVYCVATGVTRFWDTLKSTHALSYELWKLRERYGNGIPEDPLSQLLVRKQFHHGRVDIADIVCNPIPSCISHVGMQVLVVQYDSAQSEWQFAMMQRSDQVVGKRGYYQFPPSGQFELFNYTLDPMPANLRKQFDMSGTIFREFAEEIFGIEEYQDNKDKPYSDIQSQPNVAELRSLLQTGEARLDFIGLVVAPEALRHEFAFLLTIAGERSSTWVPKSGIETKRGTLDFFNLAQLVERFDPVDSAAAENLLYDGSAGLFNLALPHLIERNIIAAQDESYVRNGTGVSTT